MRPSIRISAILWGTILLVALWCFATRLWTFRRIFFTHSGIAVTQREAYDLYHNGSWSQTNRTQYIPKIIHQVFHNWDDPNNETLPADWDDVRKTCIDLNPGFEYRLWTAKTSRALIVQQYPFFLKTYDAYPHAIQRVDAARYFILLHYGGIYLDLDNGCKTDLSPLLYFPTWTCDPGRGALSNNILASAPNHPFWMYLTQKLLEYDVDWIFPYVTISWASGQWFESAVWEGYHDLLPSASNKGKTTLEGNGDDGGQLYRIMMDDREGADEWVFFTQERGGSWINWDNRMFLWIGDHLGVVILMLGAAVGIAACVGLRISRRMKLRDGMMAKERRTSLSRSGFGFGYGYERLDSRRGSDT
ncbi:family 32 putative glycosyltransferase [Rhypophila decipiens]